MTFGSLFSGVGGLDLGLKRAGLRCLWQCETDRRCREVLARHWPDIPCYPDVRDIDGTTVRPDLLCGGDPCPVRSRGRHIHGTSSPDLWPEFLRAVSVLRPLWVLREHVVADDTDDRRADLCRLGYDAVVVAADGVTVTGQSRPREYLCGVLAAAGICPGRVFPLASGGGRHAAKGRQAGPVAACLTAHERRHDAGDNYVYEPGRGLRILAPVERERLAGLPDGWTAGFPVRTRARMTGNAAIPAVAEWFGRKILAENRRIDRC